MVNTATSAKGNPGITCPNWIQSVIVYVPNEETNAYVCVVSQLVYLI